MKNYYLFLDESKPNDIYNHFCLGGCVLSEENYRNIVPQVNKLKQEIFGDINVILHEAEIRFAKREPYKIFKNKILREKFWDNFHKIYTKNEILTLCVAINTNEYNRIYNSSYKNDEYLVAMQILLENFVHFLETNDGMGSVYLESRNPTDDNKISNHYHIIKATGTLFFNRNAFQRRLGTISFPLKTDNNVGLQMADFIPNPVTRFCGGLDQKEYSLYNIIIEKLYHGSVNLTDRFGLKQIP